MNKLQNTLNILNSETGSKLFHEWHYEWSEELTEDGDAHLLIKAKFFFDGAEIHICEWAWNLAPHELLATKSHKETYFSSVLGEQILVMEMDVTSCSVVHLLYRAFLSEFNIAYNLAEGEKQS